MLFSRVSLEMTASFKVEKKIALKKAKGSSVTTIRCSSFIQLEHGFSDPCFLSIFWKSDLKLSCFFLMTGDQVFF